MSDEALKKRLETFEKATEWADIVMWLNRLNEELVSVNIKKFSQNEILAKRLANCLSSSLPSSVHFLALDSYAIIFGKLCEPVEGKRQAWGKTLGIFAPGLFTFYQFSKLEVKIKCIDLLETKFITMGAELCFALNGIVGALLVGLEEQNEKAVSKTEALFHKIETLVSTRLFYGTIWQLICNISKVRLSAFKFLSKTIGGDTTKVYVTADPFLMSNNFDSPFLSDKKGFRALRCELVELHDIPEITAHYFPRKETLVCNAIKSALMDDSLFVKRSVYDFILRFFPLDGVILTDSEKIFIISSVIDSIMCKNESVTRRIYSYLFDIIKSSVVISDSKQSALSLVAEGIKKKLNSVNFEEESSIKETTILFPILIISKILEDEPTVSNSLFEYLALAVAQFAERAAAALEISAEQASRRRLLEQTAKVLLGSEERSLVLFETFARNLNYIPDSSSTVLQSTIKSLRFVIECVRNETHPILGAYLELVISKLLNIVGFATDPTEALNLLLILWECHQPQAGPWVEESVHVFAEQYRKILSDNVLVSLGNLRHFTTLAVRCYFLAKWPYDLTELLLSVIFKEKKIPEFVTIYLDALFNCPDLLENVPEESQLELISIFWDLLQRTSVSKKIVELSFAIETVWGKTYSEFVLQEFNKEKNEEDSISRFSKLWRGAEVYCKGRAPLAFDPRCLFGMLNFLIHENPMVRHASLTWLRALPTLEAVLNPLCEKLLTATDEQSCIQDDSNNLFYSAQYDIQQVLYILKLLKSLLLSHKEKLIPFIIGYEISATCEEQLKIQKAIKLFNPANKKRNYLNLLLNQRIILFVKKYMYILDIIRPYYWKLCIILSVGIKHFETLYYFERWNQTF